MTDVLATNPVVRVIGLSLVQFLWQGAIIAGLTAFALALVPRSNARMRYSIACLGLAAMAMTAMVTVAAHASTETTLDPQLSRPPVSSAIDRTGGLAAGESAVSSNSTASWVRSQIDQRLPIFVVVWATGVLLLTVQLLASWIRVERVRRRGTRVAAEVWSRRLRNVARALGVTRPVRAVESSLLDVPTVIGWLRPVILFPIGVVGGLSPFQLEAILAHELAHIRRRDYLVNVLQSLAETLLFYHPGVWWVSAQIRLEREHCCDDLAVEVCGDRVAYARALMSLEEWRGQGRELAVAATGGSLVGRVRRLLGVPSHDQRRSAAWVAASAAFITLSIGWASEKPAHATSMVETPSASALVTPTLPSNVIVAPALQQPRDRAVTPQSPISKDEAQVRAVEEQYRAAVLLRDASTLERLLDDGVTGTDQNGNKRDKQGLLSTSQESQFASLVTTALDVRLNGDTAVATGAMTAVSSASTDHMLFTRVWKRGANGDWRLLSISQFRDPRLLRTNADGTGTLTITPRIVTNADGTTMTAAATPNAATGRSGAPPQQGLAMSETVTTIGSPSAPVRVGGDIKEPKKIRDVKPVYPEDAKAAGIQGIVIIEAVIDENGDVRSAKVLRSVPGLDDAALSAVLQWKFTTTLLSGTPVSVLMTVTVNFSLQ
jgi:TonB family protein